MPRRPSEADRFGFARLEMERDGTQRGFLLGPSLIDSSFQALMALADPEVAGAWAACGGVVMCTTVGVWRCPGAQEFFGGGSSSCPAVPPRPPMTVDAPGCLRYAGSVPTL